MNYYSTTIGYKHDAVVASRGGGELGKLEGSLLFCAVKLNTFE